MQSSSKSVGVVIIIVDHIYRYPDSTTMRVGLGDIEKWYTVIIETKAL